MIIVQYYQNPTTSKYSYETFSHMWQALSWIMEEQPYLPKLFKEV